MMKKSAIILGAFIILVISGFNPLSDRQNEDLKYLSPIIKEFQKKWPHNRTINLVFHGHSVPTGYMTRGWVDTEGAYPYLTLFKIKNGYPYAVINSITTSIGGEQSEQGSERFKSEVLCYRPDVLFIDYALNDRSIGLERAKIAWIKMIVESREYGTKVILLTPTPDLNEDIFSDDSELAKHSEQIRDLAKKYNIGLVDSYKLFKDLALDHDLKMYMAQNNHINKIGHELVSQLIFKYFNPINHE